MKNYIVLLIVFLIALNSCNKNQVYIELLEEPNLKEHFEEGEIKELSKIIVEFENALFEKDGEVDRLKKYSNFCLDLEKEQTYAEFLNKVKLYISDGSVAGQHISEKVFNKIWKNENVYNRQSEISQEVLVLRFDGAYAEFLQDFSETRPVLREYAESLEINGDLSPSMIAILQRKWADLDLTEAGIRLIVAIHYITIADGEITYKDRNKSN